MRKLCLLLCLSLPHPGLGQSTVPVDVRQTDDGEKKPKQTCASCLDKSQDFHLEPRDGESETTSSSKSTAIVVLPDSPDTQSTMPLVPFAWNLEYPAGQLKTTYQPSPVWDKKMWAAHIVAAGSVIFDAEVTHQGVAEKRCVEGEIELGPHPSRGELYKDNVLFEFVPVTLLDWVAAMGARAHHLRKGYWKAIGYEGATVESILHIRGGVQWFTHGCM